jgi:hypothetical protein
MPASRRPSFQDLLLLLQELHRGSFPYDRAAWPMICAGHSNSVEFASGLHAITEPPRPQLDTTEHQVRM